MARVNPSAALAHHPLDSGADLLALLDSWSRQGWLRELDYALARVLAEQCPDAAPLALLGAALASHQTARGHLLLDLERTLAQPDLAIALSERPGQDDPAQDDHRPPTPGRLLAGVTLEQWTYALRHCGFVGEANSGGDSGNPPDPAPLVLSGNHLYLRRYWRHEQDITAAVEQRLAADTRPDPGHLRPLLDALFPNTIDRPQDTAAKPDWQKLACALAAASGFAVITGGPGTGKTTTVIKLLALLQALALTGTGNRALRIRLAAPTGKAAARLNESIATQVAQLELAQLDLLQPEMAEAVRAAIPTEVSTLHRLLGARPDSRHFRHHRENPLAVDMVVVDEASMIDVDLMAALLDALPPQARLVLLGDKDQLASVEAGAVLGNLCARADAGHYTPATRDWLQAACGQSPDPSLVDERGRPLDQAIARLRHSYRFDAHSGIGHLAQAINRGDRNEARRLLGDNRFADLHWQVLDGPTDPNLIRLATAGLAKAGVVTGADANDRPAPVGHHAWLTVMHRARPGPDADRAAWDRWAAAVLAAQGRFQLLCALRNGDWGVAALNRTIERALAAEGLIQADPRAEHDHWYEGRPVLITGNDYGLGLMNGDVGVALTVPVDPSRPNGDRALRVAFPRGDGSGGVRWVLPGRLRHCETVYAMTVHKSQGSEFSHAALVLPDTPVPVVTRELIYTAVSRARHHFSLLLKNPGVLNAGIGTTTERASGLFGSQAS